MCAYLGKTGDGVQKTANQTFAHGSSSSSNERQDLQVLGNEKDRSNASLQPTTVTVTNNAAGQVTVAFKLLEVLAHVTGNPRLITSQGSDVVPVLFGRKNSNQSVVLSATTKSSSSGVQDTLPHGAFGRVQPRVVLARGSEIRHLGVTLGLLLVGIVVDKEVPLDGVVCTGVGMQSRDLDLSVGTVILACIDEQDAVAGKSKTSCKRRTTGTRSNDNVLVGRVCHGSLGRIVVAIRRELRVVGELWPCPLKAVSCEYESSEQVLISLLTRWHLLQTQQ